MGRAGRRWVESSWGWQRSADRLATLLDGRDPDLLEETAGTDRTDRTDRHDPPGT
jgi:hypothetical protein